MLLTPFCCAGKASFILDGQWGSAGKGAAAAYLTRRLCEQGRMFDVVTVNNGAQSGHTSVHGGITRVAYHLPTSVLIAAQYGLLPVVYLNAGSIIDPVVLEREMNEFNIPELFIHPNAAVINDADRAAEGDVNSAQTMIASTRKGVGHALSRKILRSAYLAKDHPFLQRFTERLDLNEAMRAGRSVLVEIPQGVSLSVDSRFYPHVTSRNCTVSQAMADAGIHPSFYNASVLVLRTYPIRVGNITEAGRELGHSGSHYPDQREISWNQLKVAPEMTTVTKRIRRVFTFSVQQMREAMALTRPDVVCLTFCDYPDIEYAYKKTIDKEIKLAAVDLGMAPPAMLYVYGPSTDDVFAELKDDVVTGQYIGLKR
jgi:adenylosuccinate synthase